MQEENLLILRALKRNVEEIVKPLEEAQLETYGKNRENVQSGLDAIMSELTMVVVLLTGADSNVNAQELELINDMRHVVYGHGIPELSSSDYFDLCEQFLRIYPNRRMTVDHIPTSVQLLLAYDKKHGTNYAEKARTLFIQFADAIVKSDKKEDSYESIALANFKELLNFA
jgi:hypothetical protein